MERAGPFLYGPPDDRSFRGSDVTTAGDAVRTIAILSNNEGLGDCIRSLYMLRALKRALPASRISWYSTPVSPFANVLRGLVSEFVDEVRERVTMERPFAVAVRTLRALPPADLVIDTRTALKRVAMARLFMRHRRFVTGCFGLSWGATWGYLTAPRHHFLERRLDLVRRATGVAPDWQGRPPVAAAARAIAARLVPDGRRAVALAPGLGTGLQLRRWPLDRFIALARRLEAEGDLPVVLLGPLEFPTADAIRAALPGAVVLDAALAGEAPVLDLTMALAERVSYGIVHDSAVCHILATFGVPLVAIFGETFERRAHPFAVRYIAVRAQDFGGNDAALVPLEAVEQAALALRAEIAGEARSR